MKTADGMGGGGRGGGSEERRFDDCVALFGGLWPVIGNWRFLETPGDFRGPLETSVGGGRREEGEWGPSRLPSRRTSIQKGGVM